MITSSRIKTRSAGNDNIQLREQMHQILETTVSFCLDLESDDAVSYEAYCRLYKFSSSMHMNINVNDQQFQLGT